MVPSQEGLTHLWVDHIDFSEKCLSWIRRETANCVVLWAVYWPTHHSWPASYWHIPRVVWHYWDICDKLNTNKGILITGHCIVIPQTLKDSHLAGVHEGHLGIWKWQQMVRDPIYWPRIDGNIGDYRKRCQVGIQAEMSLPVEPVVNHEVFQSPW